MGQKKQYYGIKYPFSNNNLDELLIDLNETVPERVQSDILHVILTPKRSRIRMPDFGTDLIKYIFSPNRDEEDWSRIRGEVVDAVSKYVPNTILDDIEVVAVDNEIYLDIHYTVKYGNKEESTRLVAKI